MAEQPTEGGSFLPPPSDRLTLWVHGVALAIVIADAAYWLAQPCTGDFLCETVLG